MHKFFLQIKIILAVGLRNIYMQNLLEIIGLICLKNSVCLMYIILI